MSERSEQPEQFEQPEQHDLLPPASEGQDVAALIKKMQQQLVFLERKIDLLISQSETRPSGDKHFSKPSRPFGRPHRSFDREHGDASGEKRFDRGRHFGKQSGEENRGFDRKKKGYNSPRESDSNQERHFKERHDGERRGFDQKKKPFSYKKKGRG